MGQRAGLSILYQQEVKPSQPRANRPVPVPRRTAKSINKPIKDFATESTENSQRAQRTQSAENKGFSVSSVLSVANFLNFFRTLQFACARSGSY